MRPYKNRRDLCKQNYTLYMKLLKQRPEILDRYLPSETPGFTLKQCKKIALNFNMRSHWSATDQASYAIARKYGWLDECCAHMKSQYWSKEECILAAKKYKNSTTWKNKDKDSYGAACKHGWLKDCKRYMKPLVQSWSLKKCAKIASKYSTRGEWRSKHRASYFVAVDRNWLNACTLHMPLSQAQRKVLCVETSEVFNTAKTASLKLGLAAAAVSASIRHNTRCGGYKWAYCDENGKPIKENKK